MFAFRGGTVENVIYALNSWGVYDYAPRGVRRWVQDSSKYGKYFNVIHTKQSAQYATLQVSLIFAPEK